MRLTMFSYFYTIPSHSSSIPAALFSAGQCDPMGELSELSMSRPQRCSYDARYNSKQRLIEMTYYIVYSALRSPQTFKYISLSSSAFTASHWENVYLPRELHALKPTVPGRNLTGRAALVPWSYQGLWWCGRIPRIPIVSRHIDKIP